MALDSTSLLQRLRRLWRHRWRDALDARRSLGQAGIDKLQALITASERAHSGEIRICVEGGLPLSYLRRHATPRSRALTLFGKLGVWDTEHNNGVLIYLLLADHRIEIVADRGLNVHVTPAQWQALTATMSEAFRCGRFVEGLATAVDEVHGLLRQHFGLAADGVPVNELPDTVILL